MCLVVYLVTDASLPEISWSKDQPAFHAERLKRKKKFLRVVPGSNAYVLGSHEGCGCGFMSDDDSDSEDEVASTSSREGLRNYVEEALNQGAAVAILAAWAGDEENPPFERW